MQHVKAIDLLFVFGMQVKPFMPYEYTEEGMLQRVNAYLEHQDFCKANIMGERWPLNTTAIVGEPGVSCKNTCRAKGEFSTISLLTSAVSAGWHIYSQFNYSALVSLIFRSLFVISNAIWCRCRFDL